MMTNSNFAPDDRSRCDWRWAMVSLSCFAGCSTLHEATETVSQPIRSTGQQIAKSADRVTDQLADGFEQARLSTFRPNAHPVCPQQQSIANQQIPSYPRSLVRAPTTLPALPAPQSVASVTAVPTNSQTASIPQSPVAAPSKTTSVEILPAPPSNDETVAKLAPSEILPTSAKNFGDELADEVPQPLFAPKGSSTHEPAALSPETMPRSVTSIAPPLPLIPFPGTTNQSTTISAPLPKSVGQVIEPSNVPAREPISESPIVRPNNGPAIPAVETARNDQFAALSSPASESVSWVRVRVRNIGSRPATQVSVSVLSPTNTKLIPSDGGQLPPNSQHRIDFAKLDLVGPGEEIDAIVGVPSSDHRKNRLRIQVRDAQGGTNHDVQARWRVSLETVNANAMLSAHRFD